MIFSSESIVCRRYVHESDKRETLNFNLLTNLNQMYIYSLGGGGDSD